MEKDHGPISESYRQLMNELASVIDEMFNGKACAITKPEEKEVGFCLLVFPINKKPEGARVNYISNCQRGDMLTALKEFIARNEGRYQHHSLENPQAN